MTGVIARHDAILRQMVGTQGEPIIQARIFLVPDGAPAPSLISSSDEKGYFNIEGIPLGRYTIRIMKSRIVLGVTGSIDLRVGSRYTFRGGILKAGDSHLVDLVPTIPPPGPGPGVHDSKQSSVMPTANLYGDVYV